MIPVGVLLCVLSLLLFVYGAAKANIVAVGVAGALLSVVELLQIGGVLK